MGRNSHINMVIKWLEWRCAEHGELYSVGHVIA
jgi:hypothetical protein